jgi:hypothetical protein
MVNEDKPSREDERKLNPRKLGLQPLTPENVR